MRRGISWPLVLILLAISSFWCYRVKAANESRQFAPAVAGHFGVPAATMIKAVVHEAIASAVEDESVTALVSVPVVVGNTVAIPAGARLNGNVHHVSTAGTTAKGLVNFNTVVMRGRSFTIETEPIVIVLPLENDIGIVTAALRTIVGAAIGAGMGASSGDERLIEHMLVEGAAPGLSVKSAQPITVTLTSDLEV